MAMDTRVTGFVTVNEAWPEMLPTVAVIEAEPAATPVARPELLTVAIVVALEDQVAVDVRLLVVPSLYVPVAVN